MQGFRSYDEAKYHEAECSSKRQRQPQERYHPSTSVKNEESAQKLRRMTLMGPDEDHHLDPPDANACRNLEVFEVTEAHGGKMGLRCLHCSLNGINGDSEASCYPLAIGMLGTNVRMMNDRHLTACHYAPGHVRDAARAAASKRRTDLENHRRPSQEDDRSLMALHDYCRQFCRNVGIVESYPARSGLVFWDENENVPHRPPLSSSRQSLDHQPAHHYPSRQPMGAPFSGETVAATPLVRRSKPGGTEQHLFFNDIESSGSYSAFRPQHAPGGQRGEYTRPRSDNGLDLQSPAPHRHEEAAIQPTPNSVQTPYSSHTAQTPHSAHQTPYSSSSQQTPHTQGDSPYSHQSYEVASAPGFPYWQDGRGAWSCKYCSHFPPQYREHGAVWHPSGNAPPPAHYIDQHLSICRGYQMPPPYYGAYPQPAPYGGQYHPVSSGPPGPPGWNAGPGPGGFNYSPPDESPYGYSNLERSPPRKPHRESEAIVTAPPSKGKPEYGSMQPPQKSTPSLHPKPQKPIAVLVPAINDAVVKEAISLLTASHTTRHQAEGLPGDVDDLVLGEDKLLLTEYFYHLMKQLRVCRFSEADRKTRGGKRENISIGYGGLQCVHCAETANSRKFFWSNVDRLANSFAEIPGHVLKCRRCPAEIKTALHELKRVHPDQMAKLPRGSQKVFFRRMWRRLHDEDPEGAQGPGLTKGDLEDVRDSEPRPELTVKTECSDPVASPVGTSSSEDSIALADRSTDECAKALSESVKSPLSPNSRVLLAIVEDTEWLSDMDCFIRRNLEVFCATEDDVEIASSDRKYPVSLHQVGIRCIHCALSNEVACGHAVAYPYSITGIYESVREFQRLHLEVCPNLPNSAKTKLAGFKGSSSLSSVLRKYYVLAAKALGMVDTAEGIRSGGESVPLGSNTAFAFKDSSVSSIKKEDFPHDPSFLENAVTPLESRKRKSPREESQTSSSKKLERETPETEEENPESTPV